MKAEGRPEKRLARRGGVVELLRLPAVLYGGVARMRAGLYDRGLLPVERLELPVVSVGNLTAGGTGKTPMVAWVARELSARGLRPGILSRGYGKQRGEELNDEGKVLARLLPDVPHVQDPDRVAGGRALMKLGVDAIVMDDGFQHRRLARNVDIVLVDATRPWGLAPPGRGEEPVRAFLPRGLLREAPAALARADGLVITRVDGVEPAEAMELAQRLQAFAPGCPIALARHAPRAIIDWKGAEQPPNSLANRELDLVSGIGNPEAFECTVRALGGEIRQHRVFPDHHAYGPSDLEGLGEMIVTTAKDAVKLPAEARVHVLDIELAFDAGEESLGALLDALPEPQHLRERRTIHEGLHG